MLRIREKQLETLGDLSLRRFHRRATEEIVSLAPPRFAGARAEDVTHWIEARMARIDEVRLVYDEETILCWLELAAFFGDVETEADDVIQVLNDPDKMALWALSTHAQLVFRLTHPDASVADVDADFDAEAHEDAHR